MQGIFQVYSSRFEYRKHCADNLGKELPRIPCVKKPADFWAFSKAGRALAELHINYKTVKPYPVTMEGSSSSVGATGRSPLQQEQNYANAWAVNWVRGERSDRL